MVIDGSQRVLVFSAHAADFCSRAGGTIARFAQAGSEVQVYDLTYGERCESAALWAREPKPSLDEVKAARGAEIAAAAGILGARIECLDFGDCPLVVGPDRRLRILGLLRAFRPDIVMTHWIEDVVHPDHCETTQAVLWAQRYCGVDGAECGEAPCPQPELLLYEGTVFCAPITRFMPQIYVDVTATFDAKLRALKQLAAQPSLSENYEVLGRFRGLEARDSAGLPECRYAEGFCRMGAEGH